MYIESMGEGETQVVFLHGVPQDPRDLRTLAERLGPRYRAHVVHLPGYGRSEAPALPYRLQDVLTQLEDELLTIGAERAILVGMSGGSYRAFALTIRGRLQPPLVVGLGAIAYLDEEDKAGFEGFADALDAGVDLSAVGAARFFSPTYLEAHPEVVKGLADLLASMPPGVLASELRAFSSAEDLRPALKTFPARVLLRVGQLDVATPPSRSEELMSLLPDAELQVVEGVGHMLTHEDLDGTVIALRNAFG